MRSIYTTISFVLIFSASLIGHSVSAQTPHHVLVGNGGQFGPANHVTVASWEISTGIYEVFDSIPASSVQDLITSGQFAWLAADSFLVKYDLSNYQRLDSVIVPGIRKLATYQGLVLATRGFGADTNYVQAYNQSDLSLAWSVDGLSGDCEGITVYEDTAYVAVPVAFGSAVNYLAAIDLTSGQLLREATLGGSGLSAGRVLSNANDIYVVLNAPFGGNAGAIEHYDASSLAQVHTAVSGGVSGGTSLHNGILHLFVDGNLALYNVSTSMLEFPVFVPGSWAGATLDTVSGDIFLTETDFFSFGNLRRYDSSGNVLDSVAVGISPEAIALDSYLSTDLAEETASESWMRCWPNPAGNRLQLAISHRYPVTISITDIMGRVLLNGPRATGYAEVDLSNLPEGTYFLRASSQKGEETLKFIKLNR